jgi:hypothetical protein
LRSDEEHEANARLIAAAPDLLRAAQQAEIVLHRFFTISVDLDAARQLEAAIGYAQSLLDGAIAKATL